MKQKLGIIDYGVGNLFSISNVFEYFGAKIDLIKNPATLKSYDKIILPGVGSFKHCMGLIKSMGFDNEVKEFAMKKKPILGICVGMQLLAESSTENGITKGFGFLEKKVEKFNKEEINNNMIPHVGFNTVFFDKSNKLFKDFEDNADFYFTHSYRISAEKIFCPHSFFKFGGNFLSSFEKDNIYGVQFHPEKSQVNGMKLLYNYMQLEC